MLAEHPVCRRNGPARGPVRVGDEHIPGPVAATALLGAAGLAAGLAIALLPSLRFAYPAGLSRIASETALTIALLGGLVLLASPRQRTGSAHRYLWAAIAVLAACALLQTVGRIAGGIGAWWAMYAGALAGAALLAGAAWVQERRTAWRLGPVASSVVVLAAAVAVVHLVAEAPRGLADMESLDPDRPHLDRPLGMLTIHLMCAAAFAMAAAGLARRAERTHDLLLGYVAMAAALEAVARVYLFLFPPVPTGWLHLADLWRLGFGVLVLAGAARWAHDAAVRRERRRIAHDLHDGLAQELAYIRRRAPRLTGDGGRLGREILDAAQRADEQARSVIGTLTAPAGETLAGGLTREASRAAAREGVRLVLALSPGDARPDVCDSFARIAGEAVANAARHGHAETVRVELTNGDGLCLRIADDGVGFDPNVSSSDGHGLMSMRERAEAIGATLAVMSRPGIGTEVRVELP